MEQPPVEPLTVEEAKARLRLAGRRSAAWPWARRHPVLTLALGLGVGMALGSSPARTLPIGRLLPRWLMQAAQGYLK